MALSTMKSTPNIGISYACGVEKKNTAAVPEASFSNALSQAVQSLEEKISEMQTKLKNGETEPSFQIGGRFFTEKEWENLMHKVDKALEEASKKEETESETKSVSEIDPEDEEQ